MLIFASISVIIMGAFFIFHSSVVALANGIGHGKIDESAIPKKDGQKDLKYVSGEVLVKFRKSAINLKAGVDPIENLKTTAFAASKRLAGKDAEFVRSANIATFAIADGKSVEDKVVELKNDPNVEYAQPNFVYQPMTISTNDTNKDLLWGLDNTGQTIGGQVGTVDADIDAPEAWAVSEGSGSAIVAIIDTGVKYDHPDLAANMWDGSACKDYNNNPLGGCLHGYDFEDGDKDPMPTSSLHGTHVAGTIAAIKNNNEGVVGVAPHAKIMAIKDGLTTVQIVRGIQFAQNNGAKIINASYGSIRTSACTAVFDQAEYNAIRDFDGLFIAAAGNAGVLHQAGDYSAPVDYSGTTSCWTGLDNVIGVAATDNQDKLAYFSDYGTDFVDVGAPGVDIFSTIDGNFADPTYFLAEPFSSMSMPSGWTTTGSTWGSGGVLWSDFPHIPYLANQNNYATAPTLDLSSTAATNATVDFMVACDTEYTPSWNDYVALEFSSDGVNFTEIAKYSEYSLDTDTNSDNNVDIFSDGNLFTYDYPSISIPPMYRTANFKLRWRWVTNGSVESNMGCFIDNLGVSTQSHPDYAYDTGTSMATPHVVGLTALAWGYQPTATKEQIKAAVIDHGDVLTSLAGKTGTGKRINAYGTLQYLNSLFNSSAKAITAFSFNGLTPNVTGTINETNHTVAVSAPYGTDVTTLVPTITISASATIAPVSGVAQDFTSPVTYVVTAQDASTQNYVVTVTVLPASSAKALTTFSFNGLTPSVTGTINETDHTVSLSVLYGTNVTALVPTIASSVSATLTPATGVAQNFTTPVTYTVRAQDNSTQDYVVTVIINAQLSTNKDITSFSLNEFSPAITGVISGNAIDLTVPFGSNVTALVPTIMQTGSSITPASGAVQNFTNPVTYTVRAQDNSTKSYVATVTIETEKVTQEKAKFDDIKISFKGSEVKSKKTLLDKIKLNLDNLLGVTDYKLSDRKDFKGEDWNNIDDTITLKLDKNDPGKQDFYLKFRSENGDTSDTIKKSVTYMPKNSIFTVSDRARFGETIKESGENFSPNSDVELHFSAYGGSYYRPMVIKTDDKGKFSLTYTINKPVGKYNWYAIDKKTGKKSDFSFFDVVK